MARYIILVLAVWGAKVGAETLAPTAAPVVIPVLAPVEKVCPTIGSSLTGLELDTEPWAFFRTIQVKSTTQLLGKIVSVPSLTSSYALNDVHGNLISKIVNPGTFWDTTKDIYNCNDVKMGSLNYIFEWSNSWTNRYLKHKVLDASGTHVADLSDEEEEGANFFSSRQHMVFLKDLAGTSLASMRKPVGGFSNLGPWSEKLTVQIDSTSLNPLAPPMDPEFVALIFGNVLGMDSKVGPYWNLILNVIIYFVIIIYAICVICSGGDGGDEARKVKASASEEKETLLGGHGGQAQQKVENKTKSFWNCCSRRGSAVTVAPMQKAEDAAHDAAASAHGHH